MEKALQRIINARIDKVAKEITMNEVPAECRIIISKTVSDFLDIAIPKYLAGQIYHGGSLLARPLLSEISSELVDAFFYVTAQKLKQQ